jgi:hypothetical protein
VLNDFHLILRGPARVASGPKCAANIIARNLLRKAPSAGNLGETGCQYAKTARFPGPFR